MRRLLLLLAVLPVACGPLPPPADTARLPPGVFGTLDQDISAMNYAAYAFAETGRTYGNPVAGAQAVLAMDYLAGEFNTSPRWQFVDPITQIQLLQGRTQTRAAVGIAADAPSQLVVDSLSTVQADLQRGDRSGALAALANPAFPAGPDKTLITLANLPYIQMANVSTLQASDQLAERGGSSDSWR